MKQLLFISLILLYGTSNRTLAQYPEWINYTNGDYISSFAEEGDFIWIGTWGGIVKLNKTNGHTIFYNKLNSGLPSNQISCIAIDKLGNKWIGTEGWRTSKGLVKFDGTNWEIFNTSNSDLTDNTVKCIAIDDSGNKWIGTKQDLVKFDGSNWEVNMLSNSGLPSGEINCISIDQMGNKWIGTEEGMLKFDGVNWTVYDKSNSGLPDNNVNCIQIDEFGYKWIGVGNFSEVGGLLKFDGENWKIFNTQNSELPTNYVECISIDNSGNKWIATPRYWNSEEDYIERALIMFDDSNFTVCSIPNSKVNGHFTSRLMIDETDKIWIGSCTYQGWGNVSGDGLHTFDGADWIKINTSSSGLLSQRIDHITIDGKKNKWIWYGWGNKGLGRFDGNNWTVFNPSNSDLPKDYITSMDADNSSNMWFGTSESGLVKFDGINWVGYDTSNSGLPSNRVKCIKVDEAENKWFGIYNNTENKGALVKFNGNNWFVYSIPFSFIDNLEIDRDGIVWITCSGAHEGLAKFENNSWTVYNMTNSGLISNYITCINFDDMGNKWIGTMEGILKFNNSNWTVYNNSNSGLSDNYVNCIAIDEFGNKWIGTERGLTKFDNTNWTVYNSQNSGLSSDMIQCISIDNYENKWIGTYQGGLYVFNEGGVVSDIESDINRKTISKKYLLSQNYPNPFNPVTTIKYSIPTDLRYEYQDVRLIVYEVLGREVATLVNEEHSHGNYEIEFDGTELTSGVYYYRIKAGDYTETKKMILLK